MNTMMQRYKTVILNGKVYIIDLMDLRDKTEEEVLHKLIMDGVGLDLEEYRQLVKAANALGRGLQDEPA